MPQGQAIFRESIFRPIGDIGWMRDASCADVDTMFFFPYPGDDNRYMDIKRMCSPCPVREKCLQYAIDQGFDDGWFGGVSPRNRAKMAGRRKNV